MDKIKFGIWTYMVMDTEKRTTVRWKYGWAEVSVPRPAKNHPGFLTPRPGVKKDWVMLDFRTWVQIATANGIDPITGAH